MPSKNIGLRIPDEILEQIDERAKAANKTRTEIILQFIEQGLSNEPPQETALAERLDALESQLAALDALVHNIVDQRITKLHNTAQQSMTKPVKPRVTLPNADGWMTTGEAFKAAESRGYAKSSVTFRREVRDSPSSIPGLVVNRAARDANPSSNQTRWLKFED